MKLLYETDVRIIVKDKELQDERHREGNKQGSKQRKKNERLNDHSIKKRIC
jgi:hypothetical protein